MIEFTEADNKTVATVIDTNRINTVNAANIKKALSERVKHQDNHLVMDLVNIKFIDSTGISVLLSALKQCRESSCVFSLRNIHPDVMKILVLMKLDKILEIE